MNRVNITVSSTAALVVIAALAMLEVRCGEVLAGGGGETPPDGSATDAGQADGNLGADTNTSQPDGSLGKCDPAAGFDDPLKVPGSVNSAADEWAFAPVGDLAYIARTGAGGVISMAVTTRATVTGTYGAATPLENQPPGSSSAPMFVPATGELFFANYVTTDAGAALPVRIYVAGLDSGVRVVSPTVVANVNSVNNDSDATPFMTDDGLAIYFASNRNDVDYAIYRSERSGLASAFGVASKIEGISIAPAHKTNPVVTGDELTIYFAAADPSDKQGSDIYVATRGEKYQPFNAPQKVIELSSPVNDLPTWISPDGCTIYFASRRGTPPGENGLDIWRAGKTKLNK